MSVTLDKFPEIAEAWVSYTQCRKQEIVRVEKTKGSGKSQTTEIHLIPRTNGYNVLPWEGGLLDQPYRLMIFFDAFQDGEAEAFASKVR
jgi:hypothetical protein